MDKKEKKEKVYKIEEELLNEVTTEADADIIDPTDKPKPKEKF